MSDLSGDFENDNLSTEARWTLDNLSGISDIPTLRGGLVPTGYMQKGAQRLRQILELGLTTLPDRSFMDECSGVWAFEHPRT
ncbi:hypothetical protein TIFTF001_036294 [Ficus carica]|uniref:Uncharacterized protein n=1 Tax=Ficus carica TaxID=3494 RepID=A0AA88ED78_FICCA|nr:hypothetical protein TIFTF001_036294 [Ficus carica]